MYGIFTCICHISNEKTQEPQIAPIAKQRGGFPYFAIDRNSSKSPEGQTLYVGPHW